MRRRWLVAALLPAALAAGLIAWIWHDYTEPGPLAADTVLIVPRGAGLRATADELATHGVIAHRWLFMAGALISRRADRFKAGEYQFATAMSAREVADLLASGRVVQHRLTIAEGLTSAEIVALLQAAPGLDGDIGQPPPEGSLLPETYFYVLGERRHDLLMRMQHAMAGLLDHVWAERSPGLPLTTPQQAVTLASIVEKETGRPDERPHVAAVFINRLKLGMRLQADPTVIYALTEGGTKPLDHALGHDDLAVVSPYNTYLNSGLPPTPIANPGRAALRAATQPMRDDDLYFVADGNGGHAFARTLAEHNRNVAQLRQQQRGNSE